MVMPSSPIGSIVKKVDAVMTLTQRPLKLLTISAAAILMVGCASLKPQVRGVIAFSFLQFTSRT
jgi:hypothetical protein